MKGNERIERKESRNAEQAKRRRSRVTGKKFNRQDDSIRRHGPMSKRKTYAMAIEKVINSIWCDDWIKSVDIAHHANKHISPFWTQLNTYKVGSIMRLYESRGVVESKKEGSDPAKWWRRVEKVETEDYEYKGGNAKLHPSWKDHHSVRYKKLNKEFPTYERDLN